MVWENACKCLIVFCLVVLPSSVKADESNFWVDDAGSGHFVFRDSSGQYEPAIMLDSDVEVRVSGPVAHVTLSQRFRSKQRRFVEGSYVYPLPETAAVRGMEIRIGDRRIVGEIHEREQAEQIYEQAREEGNQAGIVNQQRPNIFSTAVSNIPAGEEIEVVLQYTQMLDREGARFSLRLPLTITPRYQPSDASHHVIERGSGTETSFPTDIASSRAASAQLPDTAQRAGIRIRLDPGLPVQDIDSGSHSIRTVSEGNVHDVVPANGRIPMDRDFELDWVLAAGVESRGSFLTETVGGEHYGLLMMMPPAADGAAVRVARDVILVIDTSGSMRNERIVQARESLLVALEQLEPGDRFNVLAFNDTYRSLFPGSKQVTGKTLSEARAFIRGLRADGGTEILPVLEAAMDMESSPEHLKQIIFVTDGAVSNERQILSEVHGHIGEGRLFPVGIGAAPNSFLMRSLARFGRGSYTFIASSEEVGDEMAALFERIAHPVMRDIQIALPEGVSGDFEPAEIPDLYLNEPVVATVKMNRIPEAVTVRGEAPDAWSRRITVDENVRHDGIATLWAKARIEMLMDRTTIGVPESRIRPRVVDIALEHRLVSRYTSFVAVDRTPVRPREAPLDEANVTPRLPADMTGSGAPSSSRRYPNTSLGLGRMRLVGLLLLFVGMSLCLAARAGGRRGA